MGRVQLLSLLWIGTEAGAEQGGEGGSAGGEEGSQGLSPRAWSSRVGLGCDSLLNREVPKGSGLSFGFQS